MALINANKLLLPSSKKISSDSLKPIEKDERNFSANEILIIKRKVLNIESFLSKQIKDTNNRERKSRIKSEYERRKKREEELKLRKKSFIGKTLGDILPKTGIIDNIKNFLTWLFIGWVFKTLYNFRKYLSKLSFLANLIKPVINFFTYLTGAIFQRIVKFIEISYDIKDKFRNIIKSIGGEPFAEKFDSFSKALDTFLNLILFLGIGFATKIPNLLRRSSVEATKRVAKSVTTKTGERVAKESVRRFIRRYGERAALRKFGESAVQSSGKKFARSALERSARSAAAATLGRSGLRSAVKAIKPLVSRLPLIGGIVEFALSWALGDPIGRAAFKGIGSVLVGAIGTIVGGPLGAFLGGMAGAEIAGFLYDIIFRGEKEKKKRIKKDKKSKKSKEPEESTEIEEEDERYGKKSPSPDSLLPIVTDEIVGYVGSTGDSSGPHIHIETGDGYRGAGGNIPRDVYDNIIVDGKPLSSYPMGDGLDAGRNHKGFDFPIRYGAPITLRGGLKFVEYDYGYNAGYGNSLIIADQSGRVYLIGHLSSGPSNIQELKKKQDQKKKKTTTTKPTQSPEPDLKPASVKQSGIASWYGPGFYGNKTANGEIFTGQDMTAAHPTLPFGTMVTVTDKDTGKSIKVRINDRGPFAVDKEGKVIYPLRPHPTRVIDLSETAKDELGGKGLTNVDLSYKGGGLITKDKKFKDISNINSYASYNKEQYVYVVRTLIKENSSSYSSGGSQSYTTFDGLNNNITPNSNLYR